MNLNSLIFFNMWLSTGLVDAHLSKILMLGIFSILLRLTGRLNKCCCCLAGIGPLCVTWWRHYWVVFAPSLAYCFYSSFSSWFLLCLECNFLGQRKFIKVQISFSMLWCVLILLCLFFLSILLDFFSPSFSQCTSEIMESKCTWLIGVLFAVFYSETCVKQTPY